MRNSNKLKLLNNAREEFLLLMKRSNYRAKFFKFLDLFIKSILAIAGALITYSSDEKNGFGSTFIRTMGILIAGLTAIASVFTLEKRCQSHTQIYSKCKSLIPEIDEKILIISEQKDEDTEDEELSNIREYIRNIFQELSKLSLAAFTDAIYGKIIQES